MSEKLTITEPSNGKIKLVFFAFGIMEQGGGFENYVLDTAVDLAERYEDLEITILTASPKLNERLQKLLSIYYFKKQSVTNLYRESRKNIEAKLNNKVNYYHFNKLAEITSELAKYNIIYAKNEVLELSILKKYGPRLIPLYVGIHTTVYYPYAPSLNAKLHNYLYTGWLYKYLLGKSSKIKVNNQDDKDYLLKMGLKNVTVQHHAFDIGNKPIYNNDKAIRLAFVGRLTEQKGVDILIKIIHALDAKRINYKIQVAGSGEKELTELIKSEALKNKKITYLNHVDNKEVRAIYDWADATIIPSRYETLNKVAVETSIAGKIPICSNISGPREVIDSGKTGYLVEVSPDAFVTTIQRVLAMKISDPKSFHAMGAAGRKKIEQEFSKERVYDQFYKSLRQTKMENTVELS